MNARYVGAAAVNAYLESLEPRLLLTTYYVPDGIDYTGATEVTAAIQAYLDSVPNGTAEEPNTIIFHENGTYWIDGTLAISGRTGLVIDGNNALFDAFRPMIADSSSDDTFTGEDESAWNTKWSWEGVSTTRIIYSNTGKLTPTTPPEDWATGLARINNVKNTEADVTCTFRADSSDARFGVFGRRADADSDTYYYANIEVGQDHIQIMRVVDGAETQIGLLDGQTTVEANTNYTVRFRVVEDGGSRLALYAKYWVTGQSEPAWMISITDDDARMLGVNPTSRLGMWFALKGSGSTYVDNFIVNQDSNTRTRMQWNIGGSSAFITLRNMNIDGAYPEGTAYDALREAQHPVNVTGSSHDILVDNIHVTHVYGDGFYAAGKAYNITVQNGTFDHIGRQGMAICQNYNVLVYNNYIANAQRTLFDLEPASSSWDIDNIRIVGNTTGKAGNRWLSVGGTGALYVADNIVNGTYGLSFIYQTGRTSTGHVGPLVVLNNTFTADRSGNNFGSSNLLGMVIMGNKATYPANTYGTAVTMTEGTQGAGAVVGNNNFANISEAAHPDNTIKDTWTWDNTIDNNPSWTSSVQVTELSDAYYFWAPYSDATIQNGTVVGIMRKFAGATEVSYNDLATTGDLAIVMLDAGGDMVDGWNSYGQATYKGVALRALNVAPAILTQPKSQNVTAGTSVTFSVLADAGAAPQAYQWMKDGSPVADATESTYVRTAAAGDDGAQFTCVVSNKYGSVTSDAATLTVGAAVAPTITTQPADADVFEGRTVQFTVAASGVGPLSYQWQKNTGAWADITGATDTTYTTPVVSTGDSGTLYRCVVTGSSGTTNSDAATLTVSAAATPTESWTGTSGPWPDQWSTEGTNTSFTLSADWGKMAQVTSSGTTTIGVGYINTVNSADVDQTTTFYFNTNGGTFGLAARRSDSAPTTYYYSSVAYNGSTLYLYKSVDGVSTVVASVAIPTMTYGVANVYKVRMICQKCTAGTELRVKLWKTPNDEPADWNIYATDNTPELQGAGRFGVRYTTVNNRAIFADNYSATTSMAGSGSVPSAPSNLAVTAATAGQIALAWTDNSGPVEHGFIVERSADNSNWSVIATVAPNATTYADTGVAPNTRYYYRLAAYNAVGFSSYCDSVRATSIDAPGGAISEAWTGDNGDAWAEKWTLEGNTGDVSAVDIQSNAGRVLCDGSASGGLAAYLNTAASQDVEQIVKFSVSGAGAGAGFIARRTDADADTFYDVRVVAGQSNILFYKTVDGTSTELASIAFGQTIAAGTDYKVRFLCQTNGGSTDLKVKLWLAGESEPGTWSAAISDAEPALQAVVGRFGLRYELSDGKTITVDDYAAQFTPTSSSITNLTATVASPTQINLSWTDNSNSETGYRVERSPDGHTGWATVATTAAGATGYNDTGLMPSTLYCYRVAAVNAGGADAYQAVAGAVTSDAPGDVREYFTADDRASWPTNWTFEGAYATNSLYMFNNRGRAVGSGGGTILAFVNTASAVDSNQLVTGSLSSNAMSVGLLSRRSDAAPTTYYYCKITGSSATINLYKVVGGVSTSLTTGTGPSVVANAQYRIRFLTQTNGATTDLKVRVWLASAPEPETWNIQISNSEAALQNVDGRSGIVMQPYVNGRVVTVDDYICSSGSYMSVPSDPGDLSATAVSPSQINLSWTDNSNNESAFVVERSPDGSSGWTQIAVLPPGTTSHSDAGLSANTTYYYRVKACNGTGDSPYSSNADDTTLIAIPSAPSALSATPVSASRIDLSWTDNASNETGFKIERSDDGGFTFNQIDTVGADSTGYSDTTVDAETTYHYRVRAYNGSGDSSCTNIVNATTPAAGQVTVSIVASDATASEAGQDKGTFTVTRTGSTSGDLVVYYTVSGTASGADYSETLTGSVTILDGQASATIDITPVDDTKLEDDQTVILTLASGSYTIGTPYEATVTIVDNDTVNDNFESGTTGGGSGWSGNWTFGSNTAIVTSGTPHGGTRHLRLLSSNGSAVRSADLSEVTGAHLTFWWKANSFESGEYAHVEIYTTSGWVEVLRVNDGQDDNQYHHADIDLSSYSVGADFQIRITSHMSNTNDYFYIDDLVIL